MKSLYSILLILSFITSVAYSQDYYWYKGNKIPLQHGNNWYILYEDNNLDKESQEVVNDLFSLPSNMAWKIVDKKNENDINNVVYRTPSFLCLDGTQDIYVTHRFYVKLKQAEDVILLNNLANQ